MANYLSKPIETLPPTSSINTQLIAQVQGVKQGQYNLAKQQINQTLDAFENLKVLGDHNQAYIEAKLTDLRAKLDNSAYKDLSDINLSDNLKSQIKTAAKDPFIVDAIANTAKFNNFQQQLAQLKEKKPELYNDANYAYAIWKGGVQDYIDGKSNGIGNLNYTNYVDLPEEHLKRLKTLKDIKGKRVIQQRDNKGTTIEKSIDGLDEDDIRNYFGSTITSQEMEQMKINGWAKYGQNPQEAQKLVSGYYNETLSKINSKIELAEAELKVSKTPTEKEAIQNKIDALKESKLDTETNIKNIKNTPIDLLTLQLEKSSYLNGLAEVAKAEWSLEIKKDEAWYASKQLELDYEEMQMKREKHALEMSKLGLENKKLQSELGLTPDGEVDHKISQSSREGDTDVIQTVDDVHNTAYKEILDKASAILSKDSPQSDYFKALLKSRGLDENLNWINKENANKYSKASTINEVFKDNKLSKAFPQESIDVSTAYARKQKASEDKIKIERDGLMEEYNADKEDYLDTLFSSYKLASSVNFIKAFDTFSKEYKNITSKDISKEGLDLEFGTSFLGSVDKYKNEIRKALDSDKSKIRVFSNLMDKLTEQAKSNRFKNTIILGNTLSENAKDKIVQKSKDYASNNYLSTMTSYNTINIANTNTIKDIVSLTNTSQYAEDSDKFDTKDLPVSVYRGTRTIVRNGKEAQVTGVWVEQRLDTKSVGTGSNKREVPNLAKAFFEKGDAGYEKLNNIINIEQDKKVGYNVNSKNVVFEASRPTNYSVKQYDGISSKGRIDDVELLNNYGNSLKTIDGSPFFKHLQIPANAVDDLAIKSTLTSALKPLYGGEKAKEFALKITSPDIMSNFLVTPKVEDGQLSISISNSKLKDAQGHIYSYSIPTGSSNVNPNLIYIQKTFPQAIVTEMILDNIDKMRKEIKDPIEIFN